MATIKAGTYRFNDVLSVMSESTTEYLNYSITSTVPELGVFVLQGERIYQDANDGGSVSFYLVSSLPDVTDYGFIFPYAYYLYGSTNGWKTDIYGEGIQTITIPEDTEVSDEFGTWFAENAKPCISGVWKLNDSLVFSQGDIEESVNFSVSLTYEGTKCVAFIDAIHVDADAEEVSGHSYRVEPEGTTLEEGVGFGYFNGSWDWETWGDVVNVFDFGTEPQPVSAEFYEWLTANAVQPVATVTYNGSTIATLFGGQSATLKCAGMTMEGDVMVDVAEQSGGGGLAINGVIEQYKVNAGASVNAGDFVEFVQKWASNSATEANPTIFKAVSLSYDTVAVVYVATNAIRCAVLTLGENQVNRVFEGDIYRDATREFTSLDADAINASDIAIGYIATITTTKDDGTKETTYETRVTVARFNNSYSTVIIGNCYGYASTSVTIRVRSMKEGCIAVYRIYKNSSDKTAENPRAFFYDTETLTFTRNISTSTSTFVKTNENAFDIYKLSETHFMVTFPPEGTTQRVDLLVITDESIERNTKISLTYSLGNTVFFVRESETTWLAVGTYVYRITFVDGAFSVNEDYLAKPNTSPITAIVAKGELHILLSSGVIRSYSMTTGAYSTTTLSAVTKGYFLPCNVEGLFVGVTSYSSVLIRGFIVADDGTIVENEMKDTGLFVQTATTKRCPVGIAATGGTEGETVDVYVVG